MNERIAAYQQIQPAVDRIDGVTLRRHLIESGQLRPRPPTV